MTKEELMRKAIELSRENVANGGGPFGAVIAKDGEIVATGVNRVTASCDPTAHAEVSAIRAAASKLGTFNLSLERIFSTAGFERWQWFVFRMVLLIVPLPYRWQGKP